MAFRDWFREALSRSDLTKAEAARRLGVSVRTVGRWARGETEPRMSELRKVTDVFGR